MCKSLWRLERGLQQLEKNNYDTQRVSRCGVIVAEGEINLWWCARVTIKTVVLYVNTREGRMREPTVLLPNTIAFPPNEKDLVSGNEQRIPAESQLDWQLYNMLCC
jgi:hypothetical protein